MHRIRHTAAHVLAMAVLKLWPDTKLGIGPVIEEGFYYDFLFPVEITNEHLAQIEEEMKKIIEQDLPVKQIFKDKKEAIEFYKKWNQPFKLELLKEIPDEKVSFYVIGDEKTGFVDLCKGPHATRTGEIGAVKLLNIAGAYWRGNEKNPMLIRIYGTAFLTEEELQEFLKAKEEAQKRDHRLLNKKLHYFHFDPELIGPGLPILLPRGAYIREQLEDWVVSLYKKYGHKRVYTPHVAKEKLWLTSGHLPYFEENMFPKMKRGNEVYYVKAMNCPLHIQVYKRLVQSYRDLPFRVTDMATVYRYEKPGELHGLTRVRSLTQDDGHIFCTREQVPEELARLLSLAKEIYSTLGFEDITVDISTRSEEKASKYLGDKKLWEEAEEALIEAVKKVGWEYKVVPGEAAFYGPKIDFHVKDAMGRSWQLATIQLDFNLPKRFGLKYTTKEGGEETPVMIHRAFLGSFERFMGVLLEIYGSNLPLWLEYEKVRVIPVNDKVVDYANQVKEVLEAEGINTSVDTKDEPLSNKIRRAEQDRIPYILIVGPKEKESNTVSVRVRNHGDVGLYSLDKFLDALKTEIEGKLIKSPLLQ